MKPLSKKKEKVWTTTQNMWGVFSHWGVHRLYNLREHAEEDVKRNTTKGDDGLNFFVERFKVKISTLPPTRVSKRKK